MEVEATEEAATNEPMDLMTALQMVLKKSLAEDGLHRGLREACKVCVESSRRGIVACFGRGRGASWLPGNP